MAENEDGQEKSEEATSRRLQQAREKGQVARSKELGTSAVLLAAAVGFAMLGPSLAASLASVMSRIFSMERDQIFDTNSMFNVWGIVAAELGWPMAGFILFLGFVAFVGNIVLAVSVFRPRHLCPRQ